MYKLADYSITEAQSKYLPSMDAFLTDFAPVPPPKEDNAWLDFFLDIATAGAVSGLGKLFKTGMYLGIM